MPLKPANLPIGLGPVKASFVLRISLRFIVAQTNRHIHWPFMASVRVFGSMFLSTKYFPIGAFYSNSLPDNCKFNLFKFTPSSGSQMGYVEAELALSATGIYEGDLVNDLKIISNKFPMCRFWLKIISPVTFKIVILNYSLFDYELFVAKHIEKIIEKNLIEKFNISSISQKEMIYKYNDSFDSSLHTLDRSVFDTAFPKTKSGALNSVIISNIKNTFNGNSPELLASIRELAISCGFKFCYYKSSVDSYLFCFGRGRVGVDGIVEDLDHKQFSAGVKQIIHKHKFEIGLNKGFNYESNRIWLIKDESEIDYFI